MLFRWSSGSGIWENGTDKWGWFKSLETANFIQSIRQLILCGLRKLTWVKLLWVCVVYIDRAKPHMAKSCFSTEEYTGSFKHSVNSSKQEWVVWSKLTPIHTWEEPKTYSKNNILIWRNRGHKTHVLFLRASSQTLRILLTWLNSWTMFQQCLSSSGEDMLFQITIDWYFYGSI